MIVKYRSADSLHKRIALFCQPVYAMKFLFQLNLVKTGGVFPWQTQYVDLDQGISVAFFHFR